MYGEAFETEVTRLISLYPEPRGAVLPILHLVQQHNDRWVPLEAEAWVAQRLNLTEAHVHGILTFYTMFQTAPVGKYLLQVCTTISCMLRGCDRVLEHIQRKLDIEVGETTGDGLFTLMRVECLGSCGTAPMLQVNDDYYEDMDIPRIDALLDGLARGEAPFPPGPGPRRVLVE